MTEILMGIGVSLMIIGSLVATFHKRFPMKLHWMTVSDTVGASLVIIATMVNGFEPLKGLFALMFIFIWGPMITHTISRTLISRLRR